MQIDGWIALIFLLGVLAAFEKKWFACIVITLIAACVMQIPQARADSLLILGASKHFNTDKKHREKNWGIGYEWNGWLAGTYLNSNDRRTVFIMYPVWQYRVTDSLTLSLPVGVATGYSLPVTPVALPTVSFQFRPKAHIDVGIMPGISSRETILGAQLRIELAP